MTDEAKRMLEIKHEDGWTKVFINSSSLDVIQTCKRKARYLLDLKVRTDKVSEGALFGSAIHKGLEAWYLTHDEDAAIEAFKRSASTLVALHDKDKRHPNNGITILKNYFEVYKDDPYEIHRDSGGPVVERDFQFELFRDEGNHLVIFLFGRIDCVFRNRDTGEIVVVDHKTTSSLGQEFYQRINPNFQYTTYIMGVQRAFGIQTDRFLVNGIQVAKTKWDLARQFTTRDEVDFEEASNAYVSAVRDYLRCKEDGVWPMTAPNPCSMWGGCQYREVCSVPEAVRGELLKNMYSGNRPEVQDEP